MDKTSSEIEEIRKFLGPLGRGYTDAQLRQLRYEMQAMAELLLDFYEMKKSGANNPASREASFDSLREGV